MRALVTGASGFLGRALVGRLAAAGVGVRAFGRDAARLPEVAERSVGDLRDRAALGRAVEGMDWIFHAGARVTTQGSWEAFEAVNVSATRALFEAAEAAGVECFVYVSSLAVYDVPADGATITEETPYDPLPEARGHYARSKLAADRWLMGTRSALRLVVVRPGVLYGPGRRPPLGRRSVAVGPLRVIFGSPNYLLPLAYVDNVADALLAAAERGPAGPRAYTIVDPQRPLRQYLGLYRRASGERWRAVFVPPGAVSTALRVAGAAARLTGRRFPVTHHQAVRTLWSARFSTARAEAELGWRPRIPLEEGLQRALGRAERWNRSAAAAPRPADAP